MNAISSKAVRSSMYLAVGALAACSSSGAKPSETAAAPAANGAAPTPQQLAQQANQQATQQDHARLMKMLGMTSIRTGASGTATAPNAANYDEAKANPYPFLPDPLLTLGRDKVATADMWWKVRRPEIVELFDREMYGRVPAELPAVRWEVKSQKDTTNGTFPITRKELVGHVDNSAFPGITVDIQVTLATPAGKTGTPVMLLFSGGGFGFGPPPAGRAGAPGAPGGAPGAGRAGGPPPGAPGGRAGGAPGGPPPGPSAQQQLLAKGWGYALLNTGSVQADNGAGLTKGIIGLANKGQPRSLEDWGVLRAWAWGASKVLDYFETDKAVDAKRVGLEGHSRWGKATIVAMAYDQRFSIAYVSSSGEGGAKLHRRNAGELVENVAGSGEYHWMSGTFLKYAGPLSWGDLPIDAHELIAMCAPRPVFISGGANGDAWVDSRGMFMAEVAAGPVYELLGKKSLRTDKFPAVEQGIMDGDLAFRQHASGHTDGPNWPTFITFASRYWEH